MVYGAEKRIVRVGFFPMEGYHEIRPDGSFAGMDVEYLEGLGEKGVVLFSAEQRGYRILYRNLWNQNRYVGRILIDEIEGARAPGDNDLLDYLGRLVETCILKKELFWVIWHTILLPALQRLRPEDCRS